MFVSQEAVAVFVPDDPDNRIYIKAKMDYGTKNAVMDEIAKITITSGTPDVRAALGAYNTALMTKNIVRWEGPAFGGVPCTPETIMQLDPDEPLVERVMDEINRRNPAGEASPNPKFPATNGSMKPGAGGSKRAVSSR
jgi:hypothetical protein